MEHYIDHTTLIILVNSSYQVKSPYQLRMHDKSLKHAFGIIRMQSMQHFIVSVYKLQYLRNYLILYCVSQLTLYPFHLRMSVN